jgi:hypothetical protein
MSIILSGDNGVTFPNSTVQASAGSVLQVVNATYSTATSNSTSTLADTGLTATITPKFATSKILVIISHPTNGKSAANANNSLGMQLVRNSTSISIFGVSLLYTGTAIANQGSVSYSYLDSPATTSSTSYKTQFRNDDNNGASVQVQTGSTASTITLMEIAG